MSKAQILFDNGELSTGVGNNTEANYWNHVDRNLFLAGNKVNTLFPRGKTYWKLHSLQMEKFVWSVQDGY